ncbi:MAG: LamG-like jellyroll fold domain-containing protein [Planctomycetota bacterium]
MSLAGGLVRFGTGAGDGGDDVQSTIEGSELVLDGAWHHVACVRDAATGRKHVYVDGVEDFASVALLSDDDISYPDGGVANPVTEWNPYIVLGAEKHDAGPAFPSFDGYLDELRIWSRALTPLEVDALKDLASPPDAPGLVAHYRFEEGAGTTTADASAAGSPDGDVRDGVPGRAEWVSRAADPANTAPVFVPGDVDRDGAVDVADLLSVLGAWGPCPGCPDDTNGDGIVDVTDLLAVLAGWTSACRRSTDRAPRRQHHGDVTRVDDAVAVEIGREGASLAAVPRRRPVEDRWLALVTRVALHSVGVPLVDVEGEARLVGLARVTQPAGLRRLRHRRHDPERPAVGALVAVVAPLPLAAGMLAVDTLDARRGMPARPSIVRLPRRPERTSGGERLGGRRHALVVAVQALVDATAVDHRPHGIVDRRHRHAVVLEVRVGVARAATDPVAGVPAVIVHEVGQEVRGLPVLVADLAHVRRAPDRRPLHHVHGRPRAAVTLEAAQTVRHVPAEEAGLARPLVLPAVTQRADVPVARADRRADVGDEPVTDDAVGVGPVVFVPRRHLARAELLPVTDDAAVTGRGLGQVAGLRHARVVAGRAFAVP